MTRNDLRTTWRRRSWRGFPGKTGLGQRASSLKETAARQGGRRGQIPSVDPHLGFARVSRQGLQESAGGAKEPEPTAQAVGTRVKVHRAPTGAKQRLESRALTMYRPCRGSRASVRDSHGLRRGLRFFRAFGARRNETLSGRSTHGSVQRDATEILNRER